MALMLGEGLGEGGVLLLTLHSFLLKQALLLLCRRVPVPNWSVTEQSVRLCLLA